MKFDIVTIFPRMVEAVLAEGIVSRGIASGALDVEVHDLRDHTSDRHRSVDDVPYGGGPGMVMKPEPLVRAAEAIRSRRGTPDAVIVLSPQGRRFTQAEAVRLSGLAHIALLCGRYEGMDERVPTLVGAEELSLGDFVVSGGELPAMIVVDAVSRLVPGVVGDEQSVAEDSFARGLLDYPHYTRPAEFAGMKVPDVLLSGHHADVRRWRRKTALARTLDRRPELIEQAVLDDEDRKLFLATLGEACAKTEWQVHAFCLMSNHFHLVVETPRANLSVGLRWFLGTYTSRHNRRHRLFGHLFSGRFKALNVDAASSGYLKTVCDYVHLNPLRAKLIEAGKSVKIYAWSSYPEYLRKPGQRLIWLRVERLLSE